MKTEFVFVVKLQCPSTTGAFDGTEVDGCCRRDMLQQW